MIETTTVMAIVFASLAMLLLLASKSKNDLNKMFLVCGAFVSMMLSIGIGITEPSENIVQEVSAEKVPLVGDFVILHDQRPKMVEYADESKMRLRHFNYSRGGYNTATIKEPGTKVVSRTNTEEWLKVVEEYLQIQKE